MKKYAAPHLGYFDVIEACGEPGCPICRLSRREVKKYLDAILYDCVTDPGIRDVLRRSRGYCHTHGWQLSTVGRGYLLGIAILYEDVLDVAQADVNALRPQKSRWNPLRTLFSGKRRGAEAGGRERCPACALVDEVETLGLTLLCKALGGSDDAMLHAVNNSEGLCLQHLRQALALTSDAAVGDVLAEVTRKRITAIRAGLKEFIRKNDHRFQHEPIGAERDSWKHALTFLVGPPHKSAGEDIDH
jgi:hypothetical protein